MNKETLDRLMGHKKEILVKRLEEYSKLLKFSIDEITCSTDYENIAATSVRYATVIAKLEAEIQQLEEMYLYVD